MTTQCLIEVFEDVVVDLTRDLLLLEHLLDGDAGRARLRLRQLLARRSPLLQRDQHVITVLQITLRLGIDFLKIIIILQMYFRSQCVHRGDKTKTQNM